ncbi:uncharacterized protein BDR25DRAFT_323909 [Lindgomyces ingoldianus]|uniref:Uncharacterized protein n=1 Tax=Lindgomyces ingoldianus TaxID=673940 RepID=A0ACB6R209_9PLEO|nr:uncharacterized protein BDR25DRAFT_323909 [Lindgomyces ingoldianus]KAF2473359.1 hypothetical protein BDR25DRAFT_323909 [Lindgomyces ingoldianus]
MAVRGTAAVVVAFVLTSLSTIVVALRFYSRYFLVGKVGSPDWVMLSALLATWCCTVVNYYQVVYLDYSRAMESFEILSSIVRGGLLTFWIYRINYIVDLCLVKVSILLFYNYVASSHKSFHRIVRGIITIVVIASFSMIIAGALTCIPPSDAWSTKVFFDGFRGIYTAQCYDPTILWFFNAGFNLVTDLVIWILPIPFVLNLQSMPVKRRLELIGIFSIGIVAIIASAIRLWILVLWASNFMEQGKHTGDFLIWGQVEQHAGIISASIPFLRPLYRKAIHARRGRNQPSPSPAAKLLHPTPPIQPRTPIIPSPSPTFGSSTAPFKAPASPLSPISPVSPEMQIGAAL